MEKKLFIGCSHTAVHSSAPGILTHASFHKNAREKISQTVFKHLVMMQYGVQKIYMALLPFLK